MIARPNGGADRLIVALDTAALPVATAWARDLPGGPIKLGLEFAVAHGMAGALAVADGRSLFLDLKLHDIPNTVAGAVRSALEARPAMLTIHAAGGAPMIAAARAAAEAAGAHRPLLLAVTVLTSLDAATLAATGVAGGTRQQVLRLGRLALEAGADGLVCSPEEVALLRDALGDAPALVVPGIRPEGSPRHDQARAMTPAQAVAAGADWIVVGRPVTQAPDPVAAARAIVAAL